MSGNGSSDRGAGNTPLYTIKWPKAANHTTSSASGVLVEGNVRGQLALHFYNEVRELEAQVEYNQDGSRASAPRGVAYVREITDSILISDQTAGQLRDVLDELLNAAKT